MCDVKKRGSLEVIAGCMFSGKSEELIRRARRAMYAKQKVLVFNHSSDTRYGENGVISHNQNRIEAFCVNTPQEILEIVKKDWDSIDVVCIDETQFFGVGVVEVCDYLANNGFTVIVAGLDQDFRGEPFPPMDTLLAKADKPFKPTAICACCGAEATRTQRLINGEPAHYNSPIMLVGASSEYEARCRSCHIVPKD